MLVLVTWGSKRGGTEGIGRILAEELDKRGIEVVTAAAASVEALESFDAVIVGGALYANRWPSSVRRFVRKNVEQLRKVPVWFFSSGPLDDSADRRKLPPTPQVSVLAEWVGAKGHVTFGGRLLPDAKGFPASAMAKTKSGDWRNPERIRAWADELASELPHAAPGKAIDHPARSGWRLLSHGVFGWALCGAAMGVLLQLTSVGVAQAIHAVLAPAFFVLIGWHYFRARGAREPFSTALFWTALVVGLDLFIVAGALQHSLAMFGSIVGTWLPFALIFLASWATGGVMSTLPWPRSGEGARGKKHPSSGG